MIGYLGGVTFESLGFPGDSVLLWHSNREFNLEIQKPFSKPKGIKNTEIPLLSDYSSDPGEEFWKYFPFNPLPTDKMNTPIDVNQLENLA